MKLFKFLTVAGIAAIEGATTVETTCTEGDVVTQLFKVTCDADKAKMFVEINEACRLKKYSFIDFKNSFIQGDKNVETTLGINSACTDSAEYKPTTTENVFKWTMDLNGACREENTAVSNSYKFYWNAVTGDSKVAQFGQVPLECTMEMLSLDSTKFEAGAITIEKLTNSLAASVLQSSLKLTVKASPSTTNPTAKTDINSAIRALDDYAEASEADIGQHVELVLENADADVDVLGGYSMSLNKCWASEKNEDADKSYNVDKGHVLLWDQFCPKFPWVGPLAFTDAPTEDIQGYLGEFWVTSIGIQKIHFRQFGWTNGGSEVYYHCVIKVCEKALDGKCATTHLETDGSSSATETSCTAETYAAPSGRRRRRSPVDATQASVSAGINVQPISAAECANLSQDNSICFGN